MHVVTYPWSFMHLQGPVSCPSWCSPFLAVQSLIVSWQSCRKNYCKGGSAGPLVPKIQKLPGWGGVWPLPGFFWRICPHALRALTGDHLSPKGDISPTKVFLFPQNRSFNHIYLTFPLSKIILRTFVIKCHESQLRAIMGQIAQDAWIGGWGVNLI